MHIQIINNATPPPTPNSESIEGLKLAVAHEVVERRKRSGGCREGGVGFLVEALGVTQSEAGLLYDGRAAANKRVILTIDVTGVFDEADLRRRFTNDHVNTYTLRMLRGTLFGEALTIHDVTVELTNPLTPAERAAKTRAAKAVAAKKAPAKAVAKKAPARKAPAKKAAARKAPARRVGR